MKKVLFALVAVATLSTFSSCGNNAAGYGKKYCACVEKHKGQNKECADIMSEGRKKFPEGKDEFMAVAKDCMNK
jgi:hypothetical protein